MNSVASKLKFYSVIGVLNILVGLVFFTLLPRSVDAQPVVTVSTASSTQVTKPTARQPIQGIPNRIAVPSLNIDLSVGLGSYDPNDASWTLDNSRAFYADISVPANDNNGVTLIYGHARGSVFYPLLRIKEGAEAIVYTDTGNVFHYTYASRQDVIPTDLSLLRVEGPPALILQTCSGPWDAYRTMLSFSLTSVEHS